MKRLKIKYLAYLGVLLLLCIACLIAHRAYPSALLSQTYAARFQGGSDTDFAQFSFFTTAYEGKTLEDVYKYRGSISEKLTENSLRAPEGGRLISDCWSAQDKLTLEGAHGKADAQVIAVGGDFFDFHPMTLLSGSFLNERDVMKDRVVIDEVLAWMLYGSSDLAGMEVTIGGKAFVIAGVVANPTDTATQKARGDQPMCFMPYEMYLSLGEQRITGYEIVLPDTVKGFAEGILSDCITDSGELLQNSGRFSLGSSLAALKNFGMGAMRSSGVVYPYWENAARYCESWCSLFAALLLVFAALPVLTACVFVLRGLILGRRKLRDLAPRLKESAAQKIEDRRMTTRSPGGSHLKKKGS